MNNKRHTQTIIIIALLLYCFIATGSFNWTDLVIKTKVGINTC